MNRSVIDVEKLKDYINMAIDNFRPECYKEIIQEYIDKRAEPDRTDELQAEIDNLKQQNNALTIEATYWKNHSEKQRKEIEILKEDNEECEEMEKERDFYYASYENSFILIAEMQAKHDKEMDELNAEIERLKKLLEFYSNLCDMYGVGWAKEEIDRLSEELRDSKNTLDRVDIKNQNLEEEIERLKEILHRWIDLDDFQVVEILKMTCIILCHPQRKNSKSCYCGEVSYEA